MTTDPSSGGSSAPEGGEPDRRRPARRWPAVLGLLVLSPVSAEYLIGYGPSTGRPLELLAGLLLLVPLYGTVAVLIREVARRTGRGWPTVLLLSAAAGVVQAGLVDQSVFIREFGPDDPAWATEPHRTVVPVLGIDAATTLNYVGGHVVWSFAAPVAVVEACAPRLARHRWLGPVGVVVLVLLWALAAALIWSDTAAGGGATAGQLAGAGAVAVLLVLAALLIRPGGTRVAGGVPSWWVVAGVFVAVWGAYHLLPATWLGTGINLVVTAVAGVLLLRWSGRTGWRWQHVLAVAGSALVVRAALSFVVEPLGGVDGPVKYVVNAVTLAGWSSCSCWRSGGRVGWTRVRAEPCRAPSGSATRGGRCRACVRGRVAAERVDHDEGDHHQSREHGGSSGGPGDAQRTQQQAGDPDRRDRAAEVVEHPLPEGPGERDEVHTDRRGDQRRAQGPRPRRDEHPGADDDQDQLTHHAEAVGGEGRGTGTGERPERGGADVVGEQRRGGTDHPGHPRQGRHQGPQVGGVAEDEHEAADQTHHAAPAPRVDDDRRLSGRRTVRPPRRRLRPRRGPSLTHGRDLFL
ncbi:hypothetical protein [Auraticoccus monumenti]|uniref:hypothetical protein n=1 Tax=Auraticoccus monumenti TaxID=675864 RepID=UPI000B857667|nr:hypothetical protein [Auraticoccus monumenti]